MSFILDALRKSENDRQEQAETEFATVPSSHGPPATPRWLWMLGGLLAINAAVLLGLMLRPGQQAAQDAAVAGDPPASFSEQVAEARRTQPARDVAEAATPAPTASAPRPQPQAAIVSVDNLRISRAAVLPNLNELRANGTLQLPDLHVDLHVYSDVPRERFVFINMNKYQEKSRLDEGPVLDEITSDGVILEYRGTTFLLPRE